MRRRDIAWFLLAARPAAAQTNTTTAAEDLTAAKERVKTNSSELAKFAIPMSTEPAFVFKAY